MSKFVDTYDIEVPKVVPKRARYIHRYSNTNKMKRAPCNYPRGGYYYNPEKKRIERVQFGSERRYFKRMLNRKTRHLNTDFSGKGCDYRREVGSWKNFY